MAEQNKTLETFRKSGLSIKNGDFQLQTLNILNKQIKDQIKKRKHRDPHKTKQLTTEQINIDKLFDNKKITTLT